MGIKQESNRMGIGMEEWDMGEQEWKNGNQTEWEQNGMGVEMGIEEWE